MSEPFFTRGGDDGYTGFLGKGRIAKEDPRIEALGALDEATAVLGLARAHARSAEAPDLLLEAQRNLYNLMAEVAAAPENAAQFRTIQAETVARLEEHIASLSKITAIPNEFIIPGDSINGAFFDLARVVVRRAERRVAELAHRGDLANPELLRYLNRLSSLCFVLELRENQVLGRGNITLAKDHGSA
jgi:cob(I)alamin adenosyltransferase